MKPVYLEMNYFGPHEHSIIDFRKLENSAIFLIGGDTGAGKSTIFDAMTFALFASTTGDRDAKEMRSQFAPSNKPTKVIFYFEQNGKIYKVERTPEQFLAKKSGTGLTKRKATATLSIVEEVKGLEVESLATLPRDVGSDIDEILKLSAEQFKKIILLPQNDFSEFLKSRTDEKEEILKKIFGTQIFTEFAAKLKTKFDKAKDTNAQYENDLNAQFTSQIWSDNEKKTLLEATSDEKLTVMENHLATRHQAFNNAQASEKNATDNLNKATQNYQTAVSLKKQFDDLATNKAKYQSQIIDKAAEIKTQKAHVEELEWAQPLKDIVRDTDKAQRDQKQISTNQQTITKNLALAKQKLEQAQANVNELTDQADEFNKKEQHSQALTVLIPKVKRVEDLQADLDSTEPELKKTQQTIATETTNLNTLQAAIDDKNKHLVSVDDLQAKKDALTTTKDKFTDTLSPLENTQNNLLKEIQQSQQELTTLNNQFNEKSELLNSTQVDYEAQKKTRQRLMIAQLQQELTDGEPCEVCGSTVHPYANQIEEADETKLRESMDAVDKFQKDFTAAENTVQLIQNNIDKTTAQLKDIQTKLDAAQADLATHYQTLKNETNIELPEKYDSKLIKQSFQESINKINAQILTAQNELKEIKKLESDKDTKQEQLNQVQVNLGKTEAKIKTLESELDKTRKELTDVDASSADLTAEKEALDKSINSYQNNLKVAQNLVHTNEIQFNNNQTQLKDIEKQLTDINSTINKLSSELNDALISTDAPTHDSAVLENWIQEITQNKLSQLKDTIASYNKEKEILSDNIAEIEAQLKDKTQPNLEQLQQIQDDLTEKQKLAIKLSTSTNNAFKEAQKAYDTVQDILKQQGDYAKEYHAITGLYDVINGRGSDDTKLKLETFVVQNYLQQVLRYANDHFLGLLTGGRYSFMLSDTASDNRSDHGLDINVMDTDTGFVRSTKTLSGGETFIAALSIALSLSEVVQSASNGVKIDALFIDEGFGSLDDETLENAMKALERIGQNRMVGVISHVESMKDSIGQQVLIKKLGNGHSSIEIINK